MRSSRSLIVGGIATSLLSLLALASRVWTPADPLAVDSDARFLRPSLQHIFGTDQLGRDVFSNVLQGGQTTLLTALLAMTIAMVIGASPGLLLQCRGAGSMTPSWRWRRCSLLFLRCCSRC